MMTMAEDRLDAILTCFEQQLDELIEEIDQLLATPRVVGIVPATAVHLNGGAYE
jgi:hypothetical protein